MKSNINKLALLAAILTFSAAEVTRIQARDRLIAKSDKNRVECAPYRDNVRAEDRVNDESRSDSRDVSNRNPEDRKTLVASRHSTNIKETNSRGPTRERKNRLLFASRQQNLALKDNGELKVIRTDRRDDAERSINPDGNERAVAERREGVRDVALLREGRSRDYRPGRLHNRHLTKEGEPVISDRQQERLAFELDI